ncbi:MAG: hypothetical protein U0414_21395 [Polyangiaceae bacterium]
MVRRLGKGAALGVIGVASAGWLLACANAPESKSRVSGTIAAESFASPVTAVVATGSDGSRVVANVDEGSGFSLVLHATAYTLKTVSVDATETPLVLAGAHGSYAVTLTVSSLGASVDLGRVRFYDPKRHATQAKLPSGVGDALTCTDGAFGNGEPCVADAATVVCEDHGCPGMDGDHAGRRHHGPHGGHGHGHDTDDSAEASDDPAVATPLTVVAGQVAVPEHGVPSALQCGDGDREEDDE